jgi:peptide chain release factor 1
MLEKLITIQRQYEELTRLIEESVEDYQKAGEYAKERAELEQIYQRSIHYQDLLKQLDQARELAAIDDAEMSALATAEAEALVPQVENLEKELKSLLVPKDPRDDANVFIEIRAGAGGDEAGLFAAELMRMYMHYAEQRRWTVEMITSNETGIGGFKEVIFTIKGRGAYSRFKYESGVHRVQRIPSTESSGRIHTSTVTVAVMAEVEDVDIQIPESDLEWDVFRSSGAGGQNVQKNATAIRLTHKPSGLVVACQDERSQLQNRMRALTILRSRLYDLEMQRIQSEREVARRSQVGTGDRSEKIRTYNYPQSRVTDHRINVSSYNLPGVLGGDIDLFIDELAQRDEADRLSTSSIDDED